MPCVIRKVVGEKWENHVTLAGDDWALREQVEALETWINENAGALDPQFQWIADIGFAPREGARGGGPPISQNLMRKCLDANLEIYLSEYPRRKGPSEVAEALRANLEKDVQPGASAMMSAEQFLLADAEEDLHVWEDEPNDAFFIMAFLQKELLTGLTDPKMKRCFMLRCLYDSLPRCDDGKDNYFQRLIDALEFTTT